MLPKLESNVLLNGEVDFLSKLYIYECYKIAFFCQKSQYGLENEDSLFVTKDKEILKFGVADGAGGHPKGREASLLAVEHVSKISNVSHMSQIELANDQVKSLKVGAKTTLSLGEIVGDFVRYYTIGDSEIIHLNSNGRIVYNSTPHSPVGYKIAAELISQEESIDDPERHYVSSLLGDDIIKINTTNSIEFKRGHSILIGTDGLFDNLSHNDLSNIIQDESFEKAHEKISNICIKQDHQSWRKDDDISYIFLTKF